MVSPRLRSAPVFGLFVVLASCQVLSPTLGGPEDPPLATLFAGWYGYDQSSGECRGGLGSYHWNDTPNTAGVVYRPMLGYYCSADPKVVARQLEQMQQARISVILYSWWGWGDTDLDGRVDGHLDQSINPALTEMFEQIRNEGLPLKVALLVEPFTLTQAQLKPRDLTQEQRRLVLNYIWDTYYRPYSAHVFRWQGRPLVVAFDPMTLPHDGRFTIRHWTGRPKDEQTAAEGWDWFFAPPQDMLEAMSRDGVVFVYPRYDEKYICNAGADFIPCDPPRRVDPWLTEGIYEQQWESLTGRADSVGMIVLYSWNVYGDQSHIEPSDGGPAPVRDEYVRKTAELYEEFVGSVRSLP